MRIPFKPGDNVICIKQYQNKHFEVGKKYKIDCWNGILYAGNYIPEAENDNLFQRATVGNSYVANHPDIYHCFKLCNEYKNHLPKWF